MNLVLARARAGGRDDFTTTAEPASVRDDNEKILAS